MVKNYSNIMIYMKSLLFKTYRFKLYIIFFLLTIIIFFTVKSVTYGNADNKVVTLTVTILNVELISVANISGDIDLSSMVAYTTNSFCSSPENNTIRVLFRNNGSVEEDYEVRGEVIEGSISLISGGLGSPIPGTNEIRLMVIFANWTKEYKPAGNYFNADDSLTASYQTASENRFAVNSESKELKGYDVPKSKQGSDQGDRNMRFCVETGKIGTGADEEKQDVKVRIWIKAKASAP